MQKFIHCIRMFFAALLLILLSTSSYASEPLPSDTLNAIYNSPAPAFGNPKGMVIVEFYDYQCGYCKASEAGLEKLLKEGDIRLILMDYPTLGPMSEIATAATLAAMRQGSDKYFTMHKILMTKGVHTTKDTILQAAQKAGIDVDRMNKDMHDPSIVDQIRNNISLAQLAGVQMTPSFIVGGYFLPGYADYDKLKEVIGLIRNATGR